MDIIYNEGQFGRVEPLFEWTKDDAHPVEKRSMSEYPDGKVPVQHRPELPREYTNPKN